MDKIVKAILNALPSSPPMAPACHQVGLKDSSMNVIKIAI